MAPQFVDVSAFNPAAIDWKAYKEWASQWDSIARVAMRSSYGVDFVDQHFLAYRAGALAAGIETIIYYHYAYPQFNAPSAEADWQQQVVGEIRPQDVLVLDYEENVNEATAAWASAWLARQESNYAGVRPAIYASDAYIRSRLQDARLTRYPLWLANWQFTPDERPACPPLWQMYTWLQYTDRATSIPGIAGTVDADMFLGGNPVPLSIDQASNYFTEVTPDRWHCKPTGFDVAFGILTFYRLFGSNGLFGLTYLGLPTSNEAHPQPNTAVQHFERAIVAYDPEHKLDKPPGSGACYLMHIAA